MCIVIRATIAMGMAIGVMVADTADIADMIMVMDAEMIVETGMDAIAGTNMVMVTAIAGNSAKVLLD